MGRDLGRDLERELASSVRQAISDGVPLAITGGDSKAFYGYPKQGQTLDVSGHRGIVQYDPGELVLTCRAGSPLSEIRKVLGDQRQYLPFDPPAFGERATVGGTVACGFSGPGRPWSGSLRDYVLGVKMVNGAGEIVRYGGQVMKNVAGYDVSRLMCGAMGTLGLLLEVSFKVLPLPARELTLSLECDQETAIRKMNRYAGQPLPLSGAAWWQGRLNIRFSGAASEIEQAAHGFSNAKASTSPDYWEQLREQRSAFFTRPGDIWRLGVPPATPLLTLGDDCLIDWGGAQRWYRTELPGEQIRSVAAGHGGSATLFRANAASDTDVEIFHPLQTGLAALHRKLKQAFDPHGIFNPHRMSRDW